MGFFDDVGKGLKKVGGGAVDLLDKGTDVLVDKDAWKHTFQALADGPGGKTVSGEDLLNMALDSTMLIPGAGLVGGAARVGTRVAAKNVAKESTEALAKKATKDALRSPLNRAVRGKVDETAQAAKTKVLGGGGKRVATKPAKDPLDSQMGRIAAKQNAGVGTKVGFGQTKKRIVRNAALTGGANALVGAYDRLLPGLLDDAEGNESKASQQKGGGGGFGSMYIIGADGSPQALPSGFAEALAAFMKQNGGVAGQQVVYND